MPNVVTTAWEELMQNGHRFPNHHWLILLNWFIDSWVFAGTQSFSFPGVQRLLQPKAGSSNIEKAAAAQTMTIKDSVVEWAKSDNRRLLHVVYRVGDLDKTIK